VTHSAGTAEAFDPDVAVDTHGDAVVFWVDVSGAAYQPHYATYDAAPPVIGTFAAPATGVAGTALGFSATASDTWSAVASYAWSFGDGTSATGANVAHGYAQEGSFTVTLTVTDGVGNATTRTATVAVSAPVPVIGTFKLTKKKILALSRALPKKTKLKVGLNTAATVKIVFKSKHKHLVKGKKKYLKVVLKKQLPAGLSRITVKGKVKGVKLVPDTYVLTGTAKNSTGKSTKKKARLTVVRP
jgi:PKD repeat protein